MTVCALCQHDHDQEHYFLRSNPLVTLCARVLHDIHDRSVIVNRNRTLELGDNHAVLHEKCFRQRMVAGGQSCSPPILVKEKVCAIKSVPRDSLPTLVDTTNTLDYLPRDRPLCTCVLSRF